MSFFRPKGYNPVVSEMAARQAALELEKSLQVLTHTLRNAAPDVAGPNSDNAQPASSSSEPANAYSELVKRFRVNQMPARRPTPPSPKTSTPPPPPAPQEPAKGIARLFSLPVFFSSLSELLRNVKVCQWNEYLILRFTLFWKQIHYVKC